METFEIKVESTIRVTTEDIDDIMCAALEGGINYWCNKAEVVGDYLGEYASEQIARGGKLILHDCEIDEAYELTREMLLNGISLAIEGNYYEDYDWVDGEVLDTCCIDADVADVIVQLALFDEVIYG